MRNRAFGVEIEFASGGKGRDLTMDLLRREIGISVTSSYTSDPTYWRIGHDGSELELRTPILRGRKGFNALKDVMDCLLSNECYVTQSDGMHVHHDAPEFVNNIDNCIKLVSSWYNNRNLIYRFVDSYRVLGDEGEESSYGYWACPKWQLQDVRSLKRNKMIPDYDRKELNLLALDEHGSIEIRLHEGTLNFEEAEAWIRFGQRFIDRVLAKKSSVKYEKNPETLLRKIKVSPNAQIPLLKKGGRHNAAKVVEDAIAMRKEADRALKSL